jgi:spermidine synthase
MGFTLASALEAFPDPATIAVAEVMEAIVHWNKGPLGHLAGHPLKDERVALHQGDILKLVAGSGGAYDAILLDIDNGPEGLTQASNEWLYGRSGLAALSAALRGGGVLTVWSATDDAGFTKRLRTAGFSATTHRVRARRSGKGGRHMIWVGTKPIGGRGEP